MGLEEVHHGYSAQPGLAVKQGFAQCIYAVNNLANCTCPFLPVPSLTGHIVLTWARGDLKGRALGW